MAVDSVTNQISPAIHQDAEMSAVDNSTTISPSNPSPNNSTDSSDRESQIIYYLSLYYIDVHNTLVVNILTYPSCSSLRVY